MVTAECSPHGGCFYAYTDTLALVVPP